MVREGFQSTSRAHSGKRCHPRKHQSMTRKPYLTLPARIGTMGHCPSPMSETYVSFDVETSGPVPGVHALLAVGACVVGAPDRTFYAELAPPPDARSVPAALRVHGLDPTALMATGSDPVLVGRDLAAWASAQSSTNRPVFVAFNAPFDWPFVVRLFYDAGVENPFGHSALDVKAFYMGLHGTTWSETRSSKLPNDYAVRPGRPHHALSDAVAQAASFARMLTRARSRPVH